MMIKFATAITKWVMSGPLTQCSIEANIYRLLPSSATSILCTYTKSPCSRVFSEMGSLKYALQTFFSVILWLTQVSLITLIMGLHVLCMLQQLWVNLLLSLCIVTTFQRNMIASTFLFLYLRHLHCIYIYIIVNILACVIHLYSFRA